MEPADLKPASCFRRRGLLAHATVARSPIHRSQPPGRLVGGRPPRPDSPPWRRSVWSSPWQRAQCAQVTSWSARRLYQTVPQSEQRMALGAMTEAGLRRRWRPTTVCVTVTNPPPVSVRLASCEPGRSPHREPSRHPPPRRSRAPPGTAGHGRSIARVEAVAREVPLPCSRGGPPSGRQGTRWSPADASRPLLTSFRCDGLSPARTASAVSSPAQANRAVVPPIGPYPTSTHQRKRPPAQRPNHQPRTPTPTRARRQPKPTIQARAASGGSRPRHHSQIERRPLRRHEQSEPLRRCVNESELFRLGLLDPGWRRASLGMQDEVLHRDVLFGVHAADERLDAPSGQALDRLEELPHRRVLKEQPQIA
jgi:hypothetical protein